eukprot:TRINITY_DN7023_c0_g1_i7.p3 TRINITY_DN7023_c0_g1~~TRINITY_DN7023_c0_g1_i7.p3  ORF type:complete len:165 (-),score=24.10 TRINITY_DN7023_c0_g1_i7:109-603(-)
MCIRDRLLLVAVSLSGTQLLLQVSYDAAGLMCIALGVLAISEGTLQCGSVASRRLSKCSLGLLQCVMGTGGVVAGCLGTGLGSIGTTALSTCNTFQFDVAGSLLSNTIPELLESSLGILELLLYLSQITCGIGIGRLSCIGTVGQLILTPLGCLLYTSPSPRDS